MDTQEKINRINFSRYTDEELKYWLWGYSHIPTLRILFTTEQYKEALKELNRRINK